MKNEAAAQATGCRRLPPIITGMSKAELDEFKWWLRECLSVDFDSADPDHLKQYAQGWYDQQMDAAVVEP